MVTVESRILIIMTYLALNPIKTKRDELMLLHITVSSNIFGVKFKIQNVLCAWIDSFFF